jgi:hypothetical protein
MAGCSYHSHGGLQQSCWRKPTSCRPCSVTALVVATIQPGGCNVASASAVESILLYPLSAPSAACCSPCAAATCACHKSQLVCMVGPPHLLHLNLSPGNSNCILQLHAALEFQSHGPSCKSQLMTYNTSGCSISYRAELHSPAARVRRISSTSRASKGGRPPAWWIVLGLARTPSTTVTPGVLWIACRVC